MYSYLTVIVVHELQDRMHHNHCQITILLAHDPLSSSAYPMVAHTLSIAVNLPIKTYIARKIPTNKYIILAHYIVWNKLCELISSLYINKTDFLQLVSLNE